MVGSKKVLGKFKGPALTRSGVVANLRAPLGLFETLGTVEVLRL